MTDDEVDAIYRLPLGEFTSARNALAKARGGDSAIKSLEKPTLPAWAVNQVYWHERKTYDQLIEASNQVRQAHVAAISGRAADVASAESTHNALVREATQSARNLIERADERATPATLEAISETLQALPSSDPPGRLTKPLKPLGFAALMSMGIPVGGTSSAPGAKAPGLREPSATTPSKAQARENAAARKAAEKALKTAESAEEAAQSTLDAAKKAATAAERELERVRDRLVFLEKQRDDTAATLRQRTRELQDATNARIQAAQDLARLPD